MARKIVRLLGESQNTSRTVRDTNTAERPFWWAGSDLSIQLAISDHGAFVLAAQIATLIVEVKALDAGPLTASLMRKTYGAADCDASFTAADWPSSLKQLVTASFTAAEAALPPGSYRLIVRAEDGSGLKNTYLSTEIAVVEDYSESESIIAPPTPPVEYYTKPESDARYLDGAERAETAAAAAEFAASNYMVRGIYPNALAALAGGVKLGGSYHTADYVVHAVAFPIGSPDDGVGVALMGDSITAAVSDSLVNLAAGGYAAHARVFLGSRVDFIPHDGRFSFATSGYTSQQIIDTHLPQVLSSGARMCWFMAGTNDGGLTPSQYAANMTTICTALRNKGIYAVMFAPPAIPLAFTGNSGGALSAAMAAKWAVLPGVAAATGALLVPCPTTMQTSPGTAIALDDFIQSDHLHPNEPGAALIGRAGADLLRPLFNYSLDPYGMGGTIQTNNSVLAGSSGNPTDWTFNLGTGATASKSLVDLGGGVNAWRFTINTIGATTVSNFFYTAANIEDLTGKTIDAAVRCTVLSGSFARISLTLAAVSPFSQIARDLFDNSPAGGGVTRYQAGDEFVLRTPKVLSTQLSATLLAEFDGAGILEFSLPEIRSYP
ncbi:MAG: hydrolase family protein [Akkermansiaceae bacterium]|nr:hydrolase family protein [Akkermansiaceae bacterium]